MVVPQKYFNTEISLALLPGFERDKKEESQKFLELFLKLSTSAILVLNHKKLAQKPQQMLLDKVSRTYKESAPIFVLTFVEDLYEENRKTIRETINKKFDVLSEEQDRITFTGISEEFNGASEQVVNAIIKYNLTNMTGYQKQLEMLTELSKVLNGIIQDLEEELKHIELRQKRQLTESNGSNSINIQEIKEAFKEYRKYVIAKANSEIEKALTSHAGSCSDQMDKKIRDEESEI